MSTPAPVHALNRLLVAALRDRTDTLTEDRLIDDYATARDAILNPPPLPRFYLTEEDDPDHAGILDRERPTIVASWGSAVWLKDVKEYLDRGDVKEILELTWEDRKSA